ncbi:hypothetical protein [Streptomyces roseicoloratus]|uniref:TniQ protein n=1 Tax=Streptomyces roseicoloratus TaxID=2508722 RepID=A0ABY9S0N5_9ACTN|nr:hypothetical protein [Streptomyces roseicoloratus]WMX47503.1 hypothetical protein RGF97_25515 [Streptomyces roseicoloratus]
MGATLLTKEAVLNGLAVERLAIMSSLSEERLRRSLPALSWSHPYPPYLPANIPSVYMSAAKAPSGVICRGCTTRRGITADVRAHLALPDIVCLQHRVWQSPAPCDVSAAPEIDRAQHTLRRIRRLHGNRGMSLGVRDARWIIAAWTSNVCREPELTDRWHSRRAVLGLVPWHRSDDLSARIVTHPEVAILAAALAPNYTDQTYFTRTGFQLRRFSAYLRASLELNPIPHSMNDPIRAFVRIVQSNRARWRDPKSVMITETATPRYTQ